MKFFLHISILFIFTVSMGMAQSQSWKQYTISTGVTTDISIQLVSTGASANTKSNCGVLSINFSGDTSRKFLPLDIINDPSAYPWRMTVNINGTSGILIDPYHVLTAGHVISFDQNFGNVKIIPAFSGAGNPFQYAYPVKVYLLSDYSICTATDIGIIQLDRPLGSLAGWAGIGYTTDTSFYRSRFFYNPSYPSASPYDGKIMYNWKGIFDVNYTDFLYSYRTGIAGMSGSPAYTNINGNYVSYGILVASGIKFNRITAPKYDAINTILNNNTPDTVNLIPLLSDVFPDKIRQGDSPDSLRFILVNYSKQNVSQYQYNAGYYISSDSNSVFSGELIGSYDYIDNIQAGSSLIKTQKINLNAVKKPAGTYWVGVKLSNGKNSAILDLKKLVITATNNYTIKGRVVSSHSGSGINGVLLNGFPESVISDYNGNYTVSVPAGFSGTISASLNGNDITPSSFSISNLSSDIVQNFTIAKKTFTISGKFVFPSSGKGIWGFKAIGLSGEPVSDANGNFSSNIYYGWSGSVYYYKEGYSISPFVNKTYSNVSASDFTNFTAGFEITGNVYNSDGSALRDVLLSGLGSGNIYSDSTGYYRTVVDSGWSGTVKPQYGVFSFNPASRVYSNVNYCYSYQDYQISTANRYSVNLKVFLSGNSLSVSDTMTTALNYKNQLPLSPPDTFSSNGAAFIYKKKTGDAISNYFLSQHPEIVDWVIIELKTNKFKSVDTVAALLTQTGRIINTIGDTLIPVKETSGNYYVIVRHRNHIAIMSATLIAPSLTPVMYDFTTSLSKFYGGIAKLIKTGLYGMFAGDANYDGVIDTLDFNRLIIDNKNAEDGYKTTDFNLSGFINSADFMLYAPNKQNKIKTNIR